MVTVGKGGVVSHVKTRGAGTMVLKVLPGASTCPKNIFLAMKLNEWKDIVSVIYLDRVPTSWK